MSESNVNDSLVSVNDLDLGIEQTSKDVAFVYDDGEKHFEIVIPESAWDTKENTVWFTQLQLSDVFGCVQSTLSEHIQNIYKEEELQKDLTYRRSRLVASDGKYREISQYNLDMLISLGYRIKSKVAKSFRQWATSHLKELMTKGKTELKQSAEIKPYVENNMIVMPNFNDPIAAARAWADMYEAQRNAELQAKFEAEQKALAISQRDYAIATKSWIGSKREATAMNTASQKSKECKRLTAENKTLTDANSELITENDKLKDEIGFGNNWKQVTAIEWYDEFFENRDANFYSQCGRILTQISKEMGIEVNKVHETKYTKNCYYISVVDEFRNRLKDGCEYSRIKQYYKKDNSVHNKIRTLF